MPTDLKLDRTTHDLVVLNGDLVLLPTIQDLVRQQVDITLKTYRGEWGFNIFFGVPYLSNENNLTQILGKVRKNIFDLYIREAILSVDGVISLDSYSSVYNIITRKITIDFSASTQTGPYTEELELEA